MKTIIVTRGIGFIGSYLCDSLIKNNRVICVDNFFTGNEKNISHFPNNKNVRLIKHDIMKSLFLDNGKINQIYNFELDKGLKKLLVILRRPIRKNESLYDFNNVLKVQ